MNWIKINLFSGNKYEGWNFNFNDYELKHFNLYTTQSDSIILSSNYIMSYSIKHGRFVEEITLPYEKMINGNEGYFEPATSYTSSYFDPYNVKFLTYNDFLYWSSVYPRSLSTEQGNYYKTLHLIYGRFEYNDENWSLIPDELKNELISFRTSTSLEDALEYYNWNEILTGYVENNKEINGNVNPDDEVIFPEFSNFKENYDVTVYDTNRVIPLSGTTSSIENTCITGLPNFGHLPQIKNTLKSYTDSSPNSLVFNTDNFGSGYSITSPISSLIFGVNVHSIAYNYSSPLGQSGYGAIKIVNPNNEDEYYLKCWSTYGLNNFGKYEGWVPLYAEDVGKLTITHEGDIFKLTTSIKVPNKKGFRQKFQGSLNYWEGTGNFDAGIVLSYIPTGYEGTFVGNNIYISSSPVRNYAGTIISPYISIPTIFNLGINQPSYTLNTNGLLDANNNLVDFNNTYVKEEIFLCADPGTYSILI